MNCLKTKLMDYAALTTCATGVCYGVLGVYHMSSCYLVTSIACSLATYCYVKWREEGMEHMNTQYKLMNMELQCKCGASPNSLQEIKIV